ncbi:2-oxoacid:ferredoxin oxidoreductase subunit beta [Proteiniclasticum ruminis]|uniref:2-oxoglutarate ferredoxin oxidoreductase subunit beta n=1 Tax=Proteiniclasticum ruminis TaxID=398199 RepID=A0A1I4YMS7_9CLOT|nr:2-oxoacid:ferredoxin oxidoreductase subunit beta [Proteiniclasticum ruminis]SFN39331.1 2-oxoglutarate ferredoxin oxidoreductase subunit beta [Proteiniclasticum ruminis]
MIKKKEFVTFETAWCPGCGDFAILEALKETLEEMNKSPHEVLVVGGIGQAAKTPQYINANGFEGLHGRALPPAAAAKIANHKLTVIIDTGDGDSYGEGGNHFIHNIKRNVDMTHFVHDNQIYGLTKGQSSPTSDLGHVTDFTPNGVNTNPINPMVAAIGLGCGFVARAFSGDKEHLKTIMKAAINYNGYALVDILQPCVSFNKVNTFAWYKKRVYNLDLDASYNPTDKVKAFEKALEWGDKIPTGILYINDGPSYVDKVPFLQDKPLVDLPVEHETIQTFLNEFM